MSWTYWIKHAGFQATLEPCNWWALLITTATGTYLMEWRLYSIYLRYFYNPYDLYPTVAVNSSCTAVTLFPFFITLIIIKIHHSDRHVNAIQLHIPKLAMIWPTNYHKTISTIKEKNVSSSAKYFARISMVWWSSLREERMRNVGRHSIDSVWCNSWNLKPSTNSIPRPRLHPAHVIIHSSSPKLLIEWRQCLPRISDKKSFCI